MHISFEVSSQSWKIKSRVRLFRFEENVDYDQCTFETSPECLSYETRFLEGLFGPAEVQKILTLVSCLEYTFWSKTFHVQSIQKDPRCTDLSKA